MSEGYYLVCMSCKAGVVLGKSIAIRYVDFPGHELFGFSELGGAGYGSRLYMVVLICSNF